MSEKGLILYSGKNYWLLYASPGISQIVFVLSPARKAQVDMPSIDPIPVSSPPQATMNVHLWWFAETLTRWFWQHLIHVMSFTSHPRIRVVEMRPILPVRPCHVLALLAVGTSEGATPTTVYTRAWTRVILQGTNHHHLWPLWRSVPISQLVIVMGCCHVRPKYQYYRFLAVDS